MKKLKIGLKKGDIGEDVNLLGEYLSGFSYLPKDSIGTKFDDRMESAINALQEFYGFKVTGTLTPDTALFLEEKRCGNGDEVLDPIKWNSPNVTYTFENYPTSFSVQEVTEAFRQAFLTWSNYCSLVFTELLPGSQADIIIRFGVYSHSCPTDFRGPGGELAHAFLPPPPVVIPPYYWGQIHFDGSENWSLSVPSRDSDLWSVALHEIGHALGLYHSSDPEAIMYRVFSEVKRNLGQTDKEEIKNLYGPYSSLAVLNQQTNARPTFVTHENLGYLIWGEAGGIHILKTKDFRIWFEYITIPGISDCNSAPAAAVFKDKIYIAWRGTDDAIYLISSSDGQTWNGQTQLLETTQQAPSLCYAHNSLYLAWAENDQQMVVMQSDDGNHWYNRKIFAENGPIDGPTLCHLKNKTFNRLLLSWARKDETKMYVIAYDGLLWRDKSLLGTAYRSAYAPGAVGANYCAVFSWIKDNGTLAICKTEDGQVFSPEITGTEISFVPPGLGTMDGPIVQVWADDAAPHHIHIQTY